MASKNINKYREINPFGAWSRFKGAYNFEIESGSKWFKHYCLMRENPAELRFKIKSEYPCLVGVYWWHYQAKLFGISDATIRRRMEALTDSKIPESFSKKLAFLFFDVPLESPRARTILKSPFSKSQFPLATRMWAYCAACNELIMSDSGPKQPKKTEDAVQWSESLGMLLIETMW
jgi:hypothetical protein